MHFAFKIHHVSFCHKAKEGGGGVKAKERWRKVSEGRKRGEKVSEGSKREGKVSKGSKKGEEVSKGS